MEFELDEYLGLPTDSYDMDGGAVRYQIVGKSSTPMNASKDAVLDAASIIVEGTIQIEKPTISSITNADISNKIVAVTGGAAKYFLEDYAKPEIIPIVDTLIKSTILDKLFQESVSENVTTILNQRNQFDFISLFHDLHARAILAELKDVPRFDASFLDKYTWFANTINDAKEDVPIIGDDTIDVIVKKWNKIKNSSDSYEDIKKRIMNPPELIMFLQGEKEEEKEEEKKEDNNMLSIAGSAVDETVLILEKGKEKKEGENELGGVARTIAEEATRDLEGSLMKGGAFVEPKTAEEYLIDLGEFVA